MEKISYKKAIGYCLLEMEKMFCKIPFTREFHTGQKIDLSYYVRHVIEIILRIKLNNEVDAYSLFKIGYKDNLISKNPQLTSPKSMAMKHSL